MNRQWERIKATERATRRGRPPTDEPDGAAAAEPKSALDGISASLPALAAGQEMQERAANLGYDWPTLDGVLDKVIEETEELREAAARDDRRHGPRSSATCCSSWSTSPASAGMEAEAAMRAANAKFRRRFGSVERQAADRGVALRDLDFAALDALWDTAKAEERTRS